MPVSRADLEYCPGCRERKPLEEWLGAEQPESHDREFLCPECVEKGIPRKDPMGMLEPRDREIMRALFETGTIAGAARATGIARQTVSSKLAGRDRPEFRRAFQMLLEANGLDMFSLARKAAELFDAKRHQWNPESKEFEAFPDNAAQLGTLRHLTKLHEVDPPKEDAGAMGAAVQVIVQTNLHDPNMAHAEPAGTIIATHGERED